MSRQPAILFVCLGNICRSPLAEGALRKAARAAGLSLEIDSAGTGSWHVGHPPDERAQAIAKRMDADISDLRARQLCKADFTRFTHILAADHDNMRSICAAMPTEATAEISLMFDFVPGREGQAVADPYYGEADHFARTWSEVNEIAEALVRRFTED